MSSGTAIAVISTLISSVALAGVAISLLIQARQLRTSQIQASRTAQAELLKISISEPAMASAALGWPSVDDFSKSIYLNLKMKALELNYVLKVTTATSVRNQASILFRAEFGREWWVRNRGIYHDEAATRREQEYYAIIDDEFSRVSGPAEPAEDASLHLSRSWRGGLRSRFAALFSGCSAW
jgi:Family of unknown function (DUF6082)